MPLLLFLFLFLAFGLGFSKTSIGVIISTTTHEASVKATKAHCPLDINSFRQLIIQSHQTFPLIDSSTECKYVLQGTRLLRSEYLQSSGYFSLSPKASEACWDLYQDIVYEFIPKIRFEATCGYNSSLFSKNCKNITKMSHFESLISKTELQQIKGHCNKSLENNTLCGFCVDWLLNVQRSYFSDDGNRTDCSGYPFMYAAAFANRFGPADTGTANCLLLINFTPKNTKSRKNHKAVILGIVTGCFQGFVGAVVVVAWCWLLHKKRKKRDNLAQVEAAPFEEIIGGTRTWSRFTFEEIKIATKNFSRDNIIGMGKYGNVYKGILADGSQVAMKRFKNCSKAGDEIFAHKLEVIASVKHVNLLALRGYCTVTVPQGGHQRIIVCDLIQNGNLHDHLFGSNMKKLSWEIRQKIVLGMARGLAYLHYGVQPSIIHRDIKASNILVDETFESKLADFGFAKFRPEGMSHLSTRVAGTLGYVAPEYALYGQLSERSDVYSFGVVLLEILSGKKAVISIDDSETLLLSDWAWSLVKERRVLDVVDGDIPELGLTIEMERYVLIAVLCSHPVAYARPTMDQVVKMLENDPPVPSIRDRPFPLLSLIGGNDGSVNCISNSIDQEMIIRSDHPLL